MKSTYSRNIGRLVWFILKNPKAMLPRLEETKTAQETLEIENKCHEKLVGVFHKCTHDGEVVLVCHGFAQNRNRHPITTLCKVLSENGFNCFRFNFSGYEDSEGKFEDSYYTKQEDDLDSVISHFRNRGYQIRSIIGHSMGGTVAILKAARDRRIRSVIAIAPRIFLFNHSIVRRSSKSICELIELASKTGTTVVDTWTVGKKYLEEIRDISVLDAIKKIKVPLLLLHGTKDTVVDITESREAIKVANKPKRFVKIDGADHAFQVQHHRDKMFLHVLDELKNPPKRREIQCEPILVFLLLFYLVFRLPTEFLSKPLPLNYEQSWMVFTLFSVLSLQYVELTNRLRNLLRSGKLSDNSRRKAERAIFYLRWTNLFFIVTVASLALRIALLSFCPNCLKDFEPPDLWCALLISDWFTVASFILGVILRLIVFVDSHGQDLLKRRWQWPWPLAKEKPWGRIDPKTPRG